MPVLPHVTDELHTGDAGTELQNAAVPAPLAMPALPELFGAFLLLGATAFGGPAMVGYIRQLAVDRKRWVDADSFDSGVALCQTIPGATAMQTAGYTGLRIRGVAGAATTFVAFGLPAFIMMLALSALYARTHELPVTLAAFSGLRAIIVALVANATVTFGRGSLKQLSHVLLAALAAALFLAQVSPFLVVIVAGLLALILLPASSPQAAPGLIWQPIAPTRKAAFGLLVLAAGGFLALWIFEPRLLALAALMFRIDLFAFGGGFSSVPLMFHETVEVRRWLDGATLLNGIVLGQVTPGPIVITATFIGYCFAGLAGGVVATAGVFLPSFLILIAVAPYFDRLRTSPRFNRAITGILCSFVGLLLTVSARFAGSVHWTWVHLALAVGAFVALRKEVSIFWIVVIGAGFSIALCR